MGKRAPRLSMEEMRASGASASAAVRVVLITAPNLSVARELARGLVGERIAACVNLVDGISSIYRWKGAVEEAREILLLVKTSVERLADLEAFLGRHHPYEVPECIALEPEAVASSYLAWLLESCKTAPADGTSAGAR